MAPSSGKPAVPLGGRGSFPTLFKVAVYSVFLHWLLLMVEDESVVHNGLGHTVFRIMGVFYADYGIIGSRDPDWL